MTFHVVLEQAKDGWIVAECPALPGYVSQGRDEQEAMANIREGLLPGSGRKIKKLLRRVAPMIRK